MYTPKHIAEAMAVLFDDPKRGGMGATPVAPRKPSSGQADIRRNRSRMATCAQHLHRGASLRAPAQQACTHPITQLR